MRRVSYAAVAFSCALAACSSPVVRLAPRFAKAERRVYRLVSETQTIVNVTGARSRDNVRVQATATVEVLDTSALGTKLRLTIEPITGAKGIPLPKQVALVEVGPSGDVTKVEAEGGAPVALGGATDDVGALLGSHLRSGVVHLASRWRRDAASGGSQNGRVAALRYVEGYRCAIIELATRRPVSRTREVRGQQVTLQGTETVAGDISFALDGGFPVGARSDGEARFSVPGLSSSPTAIVILSHTTLRLERRESAQV